MADITGIKKHILRRYAQGRITLDAIEAISDKAAAANLRGESTVEITSSGFDSANSSGVLVLSTNDILVAIGDILDSIDPVVAAIATRRVFVRADFSTLTEGEAVV
jgi:hypothetical protein